MSACVASAASSVRAVAHNKAAAKQPRGAASAGAQRRGAVVARGLTLRSAPDASVAGDLTVTDDDVSDWSQIDTMIATACAVHAGDSSINDRLNAAVSLGPETTYEAISDFAVVEVYTAAYDGSLEDCSTIIDVHLRILAECLLKDSTDLVRTVYQKFKRMPPMIQKQSVVATAAVAEAGLLYIKEDYELVEAMLREQVEEGSQDVDLLVEYGKAKAVVDMMDRMIVVMHEEKGEVDGELV